MHILTKNLSNARMFWIGTNLIIQGFYYKRLGAPQAEEKWNEKHYGQRCQSEIVQS